MRYRKKIIAFLVTVALVSGGLVALSIQPARCSMFNTGYSLRTENRESPLGGNQSSIENELFFKTMFAVGLVIVLGVAAIYTSRKLLPRITNLPSKQIRILETAHLGHRCAVHLIEIGPPASQEPNQQPPHSAGGRRLLIGSANESITTLADLTSALEEFSAPEVEDNMRV